MSVKCILQNQLFSKHEAKTERAIKENWTEDTDFFWFIYTVVGTDHSMGYQCVLVNAKLIMLYFINKKQ